MPIQIKTKETFLSAAMPGIAFTVRRVAGFRRAGTELALQEVRFGIQKLAREWTQLMQSKAHDIGTQEGRIARLRELTPDQVDRVGFLSQQTDLLTDQHIKPACIRTALVSIEGLAEEDGSAIDTPEKLLSLATPEVGALIDEIYLACEAASGLSEEEQKNSQSPIISLEPAIGDQSGSTT